MGRLTPWGLAVDQWTALPAVSEFKADLTGKTVIVTGANISIGLEAARHFATMNPARLIIACRNAQRARTAIESIQNTTRCESLEYWNLDLANFASVRAFADRFEKEGRGRLDLLVENAGMQRTKYATTVDGWESVLQVNHLGTSLLAILLLPYLLKSPHLSATPRIVIVASDAHFLAGTLPESKGPAILEKLNDKQHCSFSVMMRRYSVSKLLNVFFTRSLALRLPTPPTGSVTVTCVNPGMCRTELAREFRGALYLVQCLVEFLFARTAEEGSRNLVWAALNGKRGELHGRFVSSCRVEEESDFVLSQKGSEIEDRLWNETIEILSKVDPRVKTIVAEHLSKF